MARNAAELTAARAANKLIVAKRKEELATLIAKRSPLPFEAMLADLLARAPSVNWKRLALSDPLKFVQCVERLAILSGYQPAAMMPTTNVVVIEKMTDAELIAAVAAARAKTAALAHRQPLDIVDVDVHVNPTSTHASVDVDVNLPSSPAASVPVNLDPEG